MAAGDLCSIINQNPKWKADLSKGKMLGVLVCKRNATEELVTPIKENVSIHYINQDYFYLAAYSGISDIEHNGFFVPPIYDLNNPDDFYKEEERNITNINKRIAEIEQLSQVSSPNNAHYDDTILMLKAERKERSQALQLEIFKYFNFLNNKGEKKNIVKIFEEAKRGLPPGGAGECAAPRLLQYAFANKMQPIAMAEFWYGVSPRHEIRLHKEFYPSCIYKCSPILKFMLGTADDSFKQAGNKIPKIIFEDEDIIVLDKPAEVLSAPAKDLSLHNVEAWLHEIRPEIKGPMCIHRLDQSTSGLMIAAKNAAAFKLLQQGFTNHSIRKKYIAWIEGSLSSECGVINIPICSNPDDRPRQTIDYQFGKEAITKYKVICREQTRTLVALFPFTGRTHQLRVHCASPFGLDAPILGDKIYTIEQSRQKEVRLMLHAAEISFNHPVSNEKKTFSSEAEF
ncbi:MAG: RluA family pseudouridine synthase [Bacteroidales bacterium]|nr:RluA family pseudouridine synthase [Bacteroidales bacterium]